MNLEPLSCFTVVLPGAQCPVVLRFLGLDTDGRLLCVLARSSCRASSCLGRWSGVGLVVVPASAVRRVLPPLPFAAGGSS